MYLKDLLNVKYQITNEGLNYYNCEGINDIRFYVMNYGLKINNMNLYAYIERKEKCPIKR